MNVISPIQTERLFPHFIDPVDGVLCLPAQATGAEIELQAKRHQLRFPLILDAGVWLEDQINAAGFAPASSRFGPYCDNILGMNWRLPNGHAVRIGERVVKSTTGYDWMRFLLHTGGRFGQPLDYVLRLRPDCGGSLVARFHGGPDALKSSVMALLHSGWMHWWDSVDFLCEEDAAHVRVAVHCPRGEVEIFAQQLRAIATRGGLKISLEHDAAPPADGLPDLVCKTTPDRVIKLAGDLARDGARCIALCYNGVVHAYVKDAARISDLARPHVAELHELGGDWHSRHLPQAAPSVAEAAWISTLEGAIHV